MVLGHLVNRFLLCRPALSVLDDLYRFSGESMEHAKFNPAAIAELRVASVLVLLCEVTMAPRAWPTVYCSDASALGYALHESASTEDEVKREAHWRERWRFAVVPDLDPTRPPGAHAPALEAGFRPMGGDELDCLLGDNFVPSGRGAREAPTVSERVGLVPPLPDDLVEESRWRPVLQGGWARPAAIHEKRAA